MPEILERDILDYFRYIWNEADTYYQTYIASDWEANFHLYADQYSFKDKLAWQTIMADPLADNLITRLANFLTRMLISLEGDYFNVLHKDAIRAKGYRDLVKVILDDNNFPELFNETLKYALITSLYVNKVVYTYQEEEFPVYDPDTGKFKTEKELTGRIKILSVDPRDIRLDPSGDMYIIEIKQVDIPEFRALATANNWFNIDRVLYSTLPLPLPLAGGTTPNETPPNAFRKKITLYYVYTKALTDRYGRTIDRNVHFIVANRDTVIWYEKNLLPNGMFPYIIGQPMKSFVTRYGRSYLSKLRSVITTYIDLLNLTLDAFRLSAMGIFEYNIQSIARDAAHQFTPQLEPGKFYPVTAPNTIRQIFNPQIPTMILNMLFYLDRTIQNRSFQTEFFQGMPTVKGRPTASEIAIKTQESASFFTDIANEIERNILSPLIYLTLVTELIYLDDKYHVDLVGNITSSDAMDTIKRLSFNERMQDIKQARIEARGLSGKILKVANLNKILQIVSVLGNMPQIIQALDPEKFLQKLFDSFDMLPDELFDMERFGGTEEVPLEGEASPLGELLRLQQEQGGIKTNVR